MKVLLTGGSRGIGLSISKYFEENGHRVIKPTRKELDLFSISSIEHYLNNLDNDFDILINNAGINITNSLLDITTEEIDKSFQINTIAPLLLSKHLIKHSFKPKGFGRILNIGTIWLKSNRVGRSTYTASKSALESITKSIALEFGSNNIFSNMLSPGIVNTDLTRYNNSTKEIELLKSKSTLSRLIEPIEIAQFAYQLTVDNECINGQNIFIDGGFKGSF